MKPTPGLLRTTLCSLALACATAPAQAQTFRSIQPILSPGLEKQNLLSPGLAVRLGANPEGRSIPRDVVEAAVRRIYAAYNTPEFRNYLSERFYDPERLLAAVDEKVPREATLRLVSINSVQTVSQQRAKDEQDRDVVESLVMVVVRAQMEFTTAAGFQRREGESELVLRFRQR